MRWSDEALLRLLLSLLRGDAHQAAWLDAGACRPKPPGATPACHDRRPAGSLPCPAPCSALAAAREARDAAAVEDSFCMKDVGGGSGDLGPWDGDGAPLGGSGGLAGTATAAPAAAVFAGARA